MHLSRLRIALRRGNHSGTSDSGGACGVGGLLPCKLGVLTCQNGSISCVGAVEPSAETCNGADDDCNGQTDDNVPGAGGSCGSSGQYPCSRGALKCEGGVMACVGAVEPQSESCNGLDDDCDGVTDDGVAGVGVSCGSSERFPCRKGLTECKAGVLGCAGSIEPQPETCNGVDDDCDGTVDDAVVDVGVSCGVGGSLPCKLGTTACEAGKVVCRGSKDPSPELCNGVDDDCDGVTDDSPGGIGESCGASSTLPCKRGTTQCVGGQLLCNGAVEPKPETCNGVDDDCDGVTDDSPSDVGGTCGSSNVAPCAYGRKVCQGGAIVCVGALAPKTETCNGVDDDCDGAIDKAGSQAPSDSVGSCGQTPGAPAGATSPCRAGTKACVGGVVTCQGSVGPTGSVDGCGVDANCDGALTNQPDKQTDPRNCGSCGNDCAASAVHANFTCVAGACTFQGCATGYYDLNGDKRCEYPCVFVSAQELCNGNDDDCDGQTDEGVLAPSPAQVCGVSPTATRTECSAPAVTVACTGGQWRCTFPAGVCSPTCKDAAEVCDGLDNNCNGVLNENVPNYGKPCASDDAHPSSGDGACRTTGTYVCNGGTALRCSATKADCASLPGGCEERCDGIDNDCDGATDEPYSSKGTSAAYFVKPAVTKVSSGAYMYSYEASRPTASAVSPGNGSGYFCARATASDPASCLDAANPACNDASIACAPSGVAVDKVRACSVPGRVPWSNVTPIEAEQTCKAVGGRLCTSDDWQTACVAGSACKWGYAPRGSACTSAAVAGSKYCNLGASYDFDPLTAGLQQGLLPTGSGALAQCWSDFSGLFGNSTSTERVYDLTGNLRELTKLPSATPQSSYYRLMGGAYSTASEAGAACDFTFYTVDSSFQLFDLGFRCCFSADPTL